MLLSLVEYHWAEHLDDALLLLGRLDTKTVPLAGGTYLLGLQNESIEAVVDLRELGLVYISEDSHALHIGAMTTLQQIVDAPLLKEFATGLLSRAALASSSSRLIRNSGTIGGTIGAGIASQADLLTALVALDATVLVRSASKTQVNLSGGTSERPGLALSGVVFKGKHERRLPYSSFSMDWRPNELILEVIIPCLSTNSGASFLRVGRTPTDVALLNTAAMIEIQDGLCKRVRLAFGGVNMEPVRLQAIERQLEGQPMKHPINGPRLLAAVQNAMTEFRPPSDIRASSAYRRICGTHLAYRALEEAMNVAYWRSAVSSGKGV